MHNNVKFGHTRLKINGINFDGKQPMEIDDCMITYNGELWNTEEISTRLKQAKVYPKTTCDTELVLLYYVTFCRKNIKKMLKDLNGMFSLAIYDNKHNKHIMIRDHIGEKPLYYTKEGNFSSKASLLGKELNLNSYMELKVLGYPANPIQKYVKELEPGTIWINGKIKKVKLKSKKIFKSEYHNINYYLDKSIKQKVGNMEVPFCVCLSGGIDSSLIITKIRKFYPKKEINTITLVMKGNEEDVEKSKYIAKKYKTIHHEVKISKKLINLHIRKVALILDQPMELGSTVLTNILAETITKKLPKVKVVLLGDGADEMFLGYRRHLNAFLKIEEFGSYDYLKRISKSEDNYVFEPKFKKIDKVHDFDLQMELVHYHMKRVDQIFSEHGLEARCPYLYKDLLTIVKRMDSEKLLNKIMLRKIIKNETTLKKDFCIQGKRPLKLFPDMTEIRNQILTEWFKNN